MAFPGAEQRHTGQPALLSSLSGFLTPGKQETLGQGRNEEEESGEEGRRKGQCLTCRPTPLSQVTCLRTLNVFSSALWFKIFLLKDSMSIPHFIKLLINIRMTFEFFHIHG